MSGETTYKITVTLEEAIVIRDLLDTLADCPIELGNDDYVNIMREIAECGNDPDIDGVELEYVKEETSNDQSN